MVDNVLKNRTSKIVLRSAFLAIGIIGVLASLGLFGYNYRESFYVYFTNLSNYLCFGIMLAKFIFVLQNKDDPDATLFQLLDFAAVLSILLTFFVFNFILADYHYGSNPAAKYEISSVLYHVVLPLMFTADWLFFHKRNGIRLYYPLASVIIPMVYGSYIYIRAALPGVQGVIYPYFFLNINSFGTENVIKWLIVMLLVYIAAGYALCFISYLASKILKLAAKSKNT